MAYTAHPSLINSQLSRIMPRLFATLGLWRRRAQERTQLARLGERELRDIGVTPTAIYNEIRKPFWRA